MINVFTQLFNLVLQTGIVQKSGVSVILYLCTRTKATYVTLIITGVFQLLVVSENYLRQS